MAEHPHTALVRKGYEAFGRGDLETLGSLMAGDATHHVPGNSPLSGDYKGRDAMIDLYRQLFELTDGTAKAEPRYILVDGRGHAVGVHRFTAQRMERTLDSVEALVFRIVGDKITDIDECVDDIDRQDAFWS